MITDEQILVLLKVFYPRAYAPCQEEIEQMRKALEAYEQSKWVSVKERLPEPDTIVLIMYDDGSYDITHRKLNGFSDWSGVTLHDVVTHWQTLPEFKEL